MRLPYNGTYRQTQGFGGNPASYARFGLKGHNGLDYATPTGTPILAPFSGRVTQAQNDPNGYGLYVKIENDKYGTILAHLKSFNVSVGQQVSEGQQIGISDNTGNSTGPHLHWGVHPIPRNTNNGYNGYIDQTSLIGKPEGGVPVNNDTKKAIQFDRLLTKLKERSITPDDKSENWIDDDKLVNRVIGHIDTQEQTKRNLEKQVVDLQAKVENSEAGQLARAKKLAQEIVSI